MARTWTKRALTELQNGRQPQLFIALKLNTSGIDDMNVRPHIFSSREEPVEITSGRKYQGRRDWKKFGFSNIQINSSGYLILSGVPGAYAASGTATIMVDLGYPADLRVCTYGIDDVVGTDHEIRIEMVDSPDAIFGAWSQQVTRSGESLDVPEKQYMRLQVYLESDVGQTVTPALKSLWIGFEVQKHEDIVLSYGSIQGRLTGGRSMVQPSYNPKFRNQAGEFAAVLARVPMSAKEISPVLAPRGAEAADFMALGTYVIEGAGCGETGWINASQTKLGLIREFTHFKASEFGRTQSDELLPAPFGDIDSEAWASEPVATVANEDLDMSSTKITNVTDDTPTAVFTLTWDSAAKEWDIADSLGTTYASYTQDDGLWTIRDTSGNALVSILIRGNHAPLSPWLTNGDTITFRTIVDGEGKAVRIDPGEDTDDENQEWCLAQWPIGGTDVTTYVYIDGVKHTTSDYTLYRNKLKNNNKMTWVEIPGLYEYGDTTFFLGSGLDDIVFSGVPSGASVTAGSVRIKITAVGATDTWQWSADNGLTFNVGGACSLTPVIIPTTTMYVAFGAITGHTLNDQWKKPINAKAITRVTWSGKGLYYQGSTPTNPAAICRAALMWRAGNSYLLWTDYFDQAAYRKAYAYFASRGYTYKGHVPNKDMTLSELAFELMRYIADVDICEGRLRLVPVDSTTPDADDVTTTLHFRDFVRRANYHISSTAEIQNEITARWGSRKPHSDEDAVQEVTANHTQSQRIYGRLAGHSGAIGVRIELPYAADEATAQGIVDNILEEKALQHYYVTIVLDGLEYANIQLGDTHVAFDDRHAPNPTSHAVGVESQQIKIVEKHIDLDNRHVTITGKMYTVAAYGSIIPGYPKVGL